MIETVRSTFAQGSLSMLMLPHSAEFNCKIGTWGNKSMHRCMCCWQLSNFIGNADHSPSQHERSKGLGCLHVLILRAQDGPILATLANVAWMKCCWARSRVCIICPKATSEQQDPVQLCKTRRNAQRCMLLPASVFDKLEQTHNF